MSVKLMAMVFDVPATFLTSPEKFVLLSLADNAWDDGSSCYPSRGLMVHKTNLGTSTVDRALRKLQEDGWIVKAGRTNMGVVEWKISVGKLYDTATPYEPERPYNQSGDPNHSGDTPNHSGDEAQPERLPNHKLTVSEPTYIDDTDGVPDELQMEWDTFLKGWAYYFPSKRQPRPTNATLLRKFKTRMKSTEWRSNWKLAVKTASAWQWAQNEGWFKAEWILHNDDNIFKILDGTFNFKNGKQTLTPETPSGKMGTYDPNARLNMKPRPTED